MSRVSLQRALMTIGIVAIAVAVTLLLGRNLRFISLVAWALMWGGLVAMMVFGPARILAWLRRLARLVWRND